MGWGGRQSNSVKVGSRLHKINVLRQNNKKDYKNEYTNYTCFFRTKKNPTLGSFFWDQALALKRAGHKVTILYSDTYSVKCIKDYMTYKEDSVSEEEGIMLYRRRFFAL